VIWHAGEEGHDDRNDVARTLHDEKVTTTMHDLQPGVGNQTGKGLAVHQRQEPVVVGARTRVGRRIACSQGSEVQPWMAQS
jgi:hypothetical protein